MRFPVIRQRDAGAAAALRNFNQANWPLRVMSARSTGSQRGRHFRFAPESDGRPSRCKSVAQCQKRLWALAARTRAYSITSSARRAF